MPKTISVLILSILLGIGFNVRVGGQIPIEGKHTFYLLSASSQAIIVDRGDIEYKKFVYLMPLCKGESVEVKDNSALADFLKEKSAVKVFSERIGEITNNYYYSAKIPVYMSINGQKVNIHISENNGKCQVGIPLIFGSY